MFILVGRGSTDALLNHPLAPREAQNDFSLRKVQLVKCLSLDCLEADLNVVIPVKVVSLGGEEGKPIRNISNAVKQITTWAMRT